jgi:hypothetical protein
MTAQSQTLRIPSSTRRAFLLLACLAPLCAAYNIIERRPVSSDSQRLHPFPKSVQSYSCSSLDGPSCRFLQEKDDITSSIASAEFDEIVDATLSGGEKSGDSGSGSATATAATNKARINFKIDGAVSDDTRKAAAQFGTAFLEMINTQLANVADDSLLKAAQAGDADATAQLQKNLQAKLESMMVSAAKEAKSVLSAHERGKNDGATGTGTGAGTGAGGSGSSSSSSSKNKGKQSKTAQTAGGTAQPGTASSGKAASSGKKTATAVSGGAKTVAAATASVNAILAELGKIPGQHSAVDLDAIMHRLDGLAKQVNAQSSHAAPKATKTQDKGKVNGKGKGKSATDPAASARDDEDQWAEDDERADDAGDDEGYYDDYEDGDEMEGDEDDQGVIYDPDERDKAVLSL